MTHSEPVDLAPTTKTVLTSGFRTSAVILTLTLALLAVGAGYGRLRFGSISAALDSLRGRLVHVDERDKSISGVRAGSQVVVSYALTNISERPVSLIGASSSCSCTVVQDPPMTLASSETGTVSVRISTSEDKPTLSGTIRLFTDEPRSPEIALKHTVRDAHSLATALRPEK